MILTDVYIPSLNQSYDVMLDENTEITKIIIELVGMINKKMKNENGNSPLHFSLYSLSSDRVLAPAETLASIGVKDGDRLMLL